MVLKHRFPGVDLGRLRVDPILVRIVSGRMVHIMSKCRHEHSRNIEWFEVLLPSYLLTYPLREVEKVESMGKVVVGTFVVSSGQLGHEMMHGILVSLECSDKTEVLKDKNGEVH